MDSPRRIGRWIAGFALLCLGAHAQAANPPRAASAASIFQAARMSVVVVIATDAAGKPAVQGSGIIVARNEVATNHHVLAGASGATITFSDGTSAPVISVLVDAPNQDLMVISAATGARPSLRLGDELGLRPGDLVYALGAPDGLQLTFTNGIVSSFRNADPEFLIQDTAPIGHGSSGGALLDSSGRVVGITTSLDKYTPGIYFAEAVTSLRRMLLSPRAAPRSLAAWGRANPSELPGAAAPAAATSNSDTNPPSDSGALTTESQLAKRVSDLLIAGNYDAASTALANLTAAFPDSESSHLLGGQLDVLTGDQAGAERELDRCVELDSSSANCQFWLALALYAQSEYAPALAHETTSFQLDPTSEDPPLLALLQYALGDFADAQTEAEKALQHDPANRQALDVMAGLQFWHLTDHASWDANLRALSAQDPHDFWVEVNLGAVAEKSGDTQAAAAHYEAAEAKIFPDRAPYIFLEQLDLAARELQAAEDQIQAGLKCNPGDLMLLEEGVFTALVVRNQVTATKRMHALFQSDPNSAGTEGTGCVYYYATGDPTDALADCARSVQLSPDDGSAHDNYAWAALDSSEYELASREFGQAIQKYEAGVKQLNNLQAVDLGWGLIIYWHETGDRDKARSLLRDMRKEHPEAATVDGLTALPLVWSPTTLTRIQEILARYPK